MPEILEIPIIVADKLQFENLFKDSDNVIPKKYNELSVLEYTLDADHKVFFYIITDLTDSAGDNTVMQIIPKAPFCILLITPDEPFGDSANIEFYESYKGLYETPLLITTEKDQQENYLNLAGDPLITAHEYPILFYEEDDPKAIRNVLIQAINQFLPESNKEVAE